MMHRVDVHHCVISFRARRIFSCLTEPLAVIMKFEMLPISRVPANPAPKNRKIRKNVGANIEH
jgi:hypothetical protein